MVFRHHFFAIFIIIKLLNHFRNYFLIKIKTMLGIFSYVRYSNASIHVDSYYIVGGIIFFLLCGILIFRAWSWRKKIIQEIKNGYYGNRLLLSRVKLICLIFILSKKIRVKTCNSNWLHWIRLKILDHLLLG